MAFWREQLNSSPAVEISGAAVGGGHSIARTPRESHPGG